MATFRLDVSTLSGDTLNYVDTALQEKGYGIVLEWIQDGANQDIRIVGHAIRLVPLETMDTDYPTSSLATGALSAYGTGLYGAGSYGAVSGTGFFILDISTLGGDTVFNRVHTALQERGRSIQLEWSQAGSGQDLKIIGHAIRVVPSETHSLEPS